MSIFFKFQSEREFDTIPCPSSGSITVTELKKIILEKRYPNNRSDFELKVYDAQNANEGKTGTEGIK